MQVVAPTITPEPLSTVPSLTEKPGRWQVPAFHSATLVSSIGSMAFAIALVAFLVKDGFPFYMIGLTLALSRAAPLVAGLLWGHLADNINPRRLIAASEAIAALLSLGLLVAWREGAQLYWLFLVVMCVRASVVTIQSSARAKVAKLLSGASYASNAKQAIWLNKVTHGATLFAGGLGWLLVRDFSFEWVIALDALTFGVSGAVFYFLRIADTAAGSAGRPSEGSVGEKFRALYGFAARAAKLDLLLAIVMCGTGALMGRLAAGRGDLIPLFLVSYGAAVWLAGYLERTAFVQSRHETLWIILGLAFIASFVVMDHIGLMLAIVFVKDLAYWILFHRYSAHIQAATPASKAASVSAARIAQMTAVLALGELGVGLWQPFLSPMGEGLWRGALCVVVALVLRAGAIGIAPKKGPSDATP